MWKDDAYLLEPLVPPDDGVEPPSQLTPRETPWPLAGKKDPALAAPELDAMRHPETRENLPTMNP
jgi:hypothetical protein